MSENERLKSLIISAAQELWDDKAALGKFLGVVRRGEGWTQPADELEKNRPANATFHGVKSAEFQA
ncbi:hypothetical protein ACGFYU_27545 [Streptomyces sp. NPDC048337]|uniref:hypothetical protein n=1 Tax=Streptomyces sp. NPDC048337 TaxID=3365535 RepID=UPI003721E28C